MFYLFLYLTGVHFRGELQRGGDISRQKIKCQNSRNMWCLIVRGTICRLQTHQPTDHLFIYLFIYFILTLVYKIVKNNSTNKYHLPTDPPTHRLTIIKIEDQILNMFCTSYFLKTFTLTDFLLLLNNYY